MTVVAAPRGAIVLPTRVTLQLPLTGDEQQITRQRLDPWADLRDRRDQLATRSAGADMAELGPDVRASRYARSL